MSSSPCALIVEDDAATREALAMLLAAEGHAAVTAANGRQALDYLRSAAVMPRLIVLDLMMPVMNGWEFLAERRGDPVLSAIPVLLFTAAGGIHKAEARDLGAAGILTKPIDADQLLAALGPFCQVA
jgi:CheY-like chemotaxis protein